MSHEIAPLDVHSAPTQSTQRWDESAAGPPAPEKNALERPLAAIRRYKYLMLGVILLASAGGVVATRLVTPQYEVQTTFMIEAGMGPQDQSGPIRSRGLLADAAWVELLQSYLVSDAVVRKLSLFVQPESPKDAGVLVGFSLGDRVVAGKYELLIDRANKRWKLSHQVFSMTDAGGTADSVGRAAGFRWVLPDSVFAGTGERKVKFTVSVPRETSIQLSNRLTNRLADGFLHLTLQDTDAERAARTLNTWSKEFVTVASDLKRRNAVEFANLLAVQLRSSETHLHDAELALESFRTHTITLPSESGPVAAGVAETRDPAMRAFFDKKIEFDQLRHDTEDMEKAIANAGDGTAPYESMLWVPSVTNTPAGEALRKAFGALYENQARLTAARQLYTDQYPVVQDLLQTVQTLKTQTIPGLAKQLLTQIKQRQAEFDVRIAGASKELEAIPSRTIEEMRLRRAVSVSEALYQTLKTRTAEADLAAAGVHPDVTVLDSAIAPSRPTKNTAPRIILIAIVGGIGAAIALAILLDLVDGKFRYPDQATNDLGLVIAGAVPRFPKNGIDQRSPEQLSQLVEAFRSLRMHVTQSGSVPLSVAVSSPSPGDGKSLISANLAMSFAEAGYRTVLVDGDTRRGALHDMFEIPKSPGLTEFLGGQVPVSEVLHVTAHQNLSFIACGKRHPRSPEFLTSRALSDLVAHLRTSYDVLIFDTPPLAAGVDAYALSAAAGKLLVVLRVGQTHRRMAAAKLIVADRLPIDILGAVLNGVATDGEYQYYGYSAGYGAVEEGEPAGQIPSAT